jgi:hypothetical protein
MRSPSSRPWPVVLRRERPRRRSRAGLAAAVLSGAVAVSYLSLVGRGAVGGEGDGVRIGILALIFVSLPLCAAIGSFQPTTNLGIGLLIVAAVGLGVMGVLGILSIGAPLVLASALATGAVVQSLKRRD